ncbi:hypothetical protein VE04_09650, partial [Pseudogymnoascus sp. 24MN13]
MPPKPPKPFSIVSWYGGNQVTSDNVSIQDVLNYKDDELESRHDFIQLIFPLAWASQHARRNVVGTKAQFSMIRGSGNVGRNVRGNMLTALQHILAMFDLELTPTKLCKAPGSALPWARHRNRGRRIRRITPVEGDGKDHAAREARFQALANPDNHHHRRITRIIRSLRLARRVEDADSVYRFFRRFAREHPTIPRRTLQMWGVAANSAYLYMDPAEEHKTAPDEIKDGEPSDGEEDEEAPTNQGGGGDESSEDGSTSSSEKAPSEHDGDGGGFGPGGDTPPPVGPDEGQPPTVGAPRMSDEDVQKLTPSERDLHHARIEHRKENMEIEIKLAYRNANGEWIAVDEDSLTMTLIDLRIWQIVLRDKEEERRGEDAVERRIKEGRDPYESSSDSSEEDEENDGKNFLRADIKRFGKNGMSAEDRQKLEPWELKLHLAQIEHQSDYLEIEVKFKFRDGDGFWKGRGPEPITMNLRDLKAWQIEIDKLEAQWLDEVNRGDRRRSASLSTKSSQESDYDVGDPRMSERCYAQLGAEDQERHHALRVYIETFRELEYVLGFRDRTTFQWISVHMDPDDLNLDELDLWSAEMQQMGDAYVAKQDADEPAHQPADEPADAAAANPTAVQSRQRRKRVRSPESMVDEEYMADRVRRGLDPFGDSPEAIVWKAMYLQREKEWEEKEDKRLEKERLEEERLDKEKEKDKGKETESDDPGEQLRTEEAARAMGAK